MAINQFMQPVKDTFIQPYVSQYIPLPFEQMQKALNVKQKQYDDTLNYIGNIKNQLMKVKARPGVEGQLGVDEIERNKRIEEYENKLNQISENYGGDLSLAQNQVRQLAQEANIDLTRGPLGEIHNRAIAREANIEQGKKLGIRGEVLQGNVLQDDVLYNQAGGRAGGSENILAPWTKDISNFTKELQPLAEDIKTQIRASSSEPRQANIPGYYVVVDGKKTWLSEDRIKNALLEGVKGNQELQSSIRQALRGNVMDTHALEHAMNALGITYRRDDVETKSRFITDRAFDEETGTKKSIGNMYIESIGKLEDDSKFRDFNQTDMRNTVVNNNKTIGNILGVELDSLPKNINMAEYLSDRLKHNSKNPLNPEQSLKIKQLLRENEALRSQQKYEIDNYYKTPEGREQLNKSLEFFKSKNISEKEAREYLLNSEDFNWLQQAGSILSKADESYKIGKAGSVGQINQDSQKRYDELVKKLNKNPELMADIRNHVTNLRSEIDKAAINNKWRTNAYQPVKIGNPVANTKIKAEYSPMDKAVTYISDALQYRKDNLFFINEDGNEQKFNDWLETAKTDLAKKTNIKNPDNLNLDLQFLPTNVAGNKYVFLANLTDLKSGITREQYVELDDKNAGRLVYNQIAERLINMDQPDAKKRGYEILAGIRFPDLNLQTINQSLKGSDKTEGYRVQSNEGIHYIDFEKDSKGNILIKNDVGDVIARGETIDEARLNLFFNSQQ